MNAATVLMIAAAAAGSDWYNKPTVGGKKLLRPHVAMHGAPPASGPIMAGPGGPGGPGGIGGGRQFANTKSQVYFVDPPGMRIGWQSSASGQAIYLPAQLTTPARYNFQQGYIYRLKLTDIPGRPGLNLYPTIEVAPGTPDTDAFLTHNPIPAQFTEEDFDQVTAGNFVTKVIYLPDPKYQELAIAGVETLVSTRLEPGVNPILEADRRGTILMIVRLGAIDLEMPAPGTVVAPYSPSGVGAGVGAGSMPGTVLPPGSLPPGTAPLVPPVAPPPAPRMPGNVPLDTAPVSPEPGGLPGADTPPPPPPTPNPSGAVR